MTDFRLSDLSENLRHDKQKQEIIDGLLSPFDRTDVGCQELYSPRMPLDIEMQDICEPFTKFCPECGREYGEKENFCLDCAVKLKYIGAVNIKDLKMDPEFIIKRNVTFNNFEDIFTQDNIEKIQNFSILPSDISNILKNIKSKAFRRLDDTIKENHINLYGLSALEKVMLFAKSFVDVEYKSYGPELGYYEFNRLYIDDRQLDGLQITTIIHELTHFMIKEILSQILSKILNCTKTAEIESIITFILSYNDVNRLIDEYAAHTVEGRFTVYGYQDYSSFISIQNSLNMPSEEIEMVKAIGNTFANMIKNMLESFIDEDLLDDIKSQFRKDILDIPNYEYLSFENCMLLNREGLIKALQFILFEGFITAMDNTETLEKYNSCW